MNLVKWITDSEIEVSIDDDEDLHVLRKLGIKTFKHPKGRLRTASNFYYIRFNSGVKYSLGAYDFPKNVVLEEIFLKLHGIGFVFWGIFKTEISPYDYMRNLQRQNVLREDFRHLHAGDESIQVSVYTSIGL